LELDKNKKTMEINTISETKTVIPILIEPQKCDLCGACIGVCPPDCIVLTDHTLAIIGLKCILCRICLSACPVGALEWNSDNDNTKMLKSVENYDR